MPIGGFVVTCDPGRVEAAVERIASIPSVTVHGSDEKGNVVAVLDTQTSDEMEGVVKEIEGIEGVLSVGLTYLNAEDEIGKIASGELPVPNPFGWRKKPPDVP